MIFFCTKNISISSVEIFSVERIDGMCLIKLISGEVLETGEIVENLDKNHGNAEILGQTVFFGTEQFNFDEIVDVHYSPQNPLAGLDLIIFGGYKKTFFINNGAEIFEVVKKNKMRIERRNSSLMQISGSGYNERIHSRVEISEIVEISQGRRREMIIHNITLRTFTQMILFGEIIKTT